MAPPKLNRQTSMANSTPPISEPACSPERPPQAPPKKLPQSPSMVSLQDPCTKKVHSRHGRRIFHRVKSAFRSFPIIMPTCKVPVGNLLGHRVHDGHVHGGIRMTGTLFGHRKSRVSLAIQDSPGCLPILLLELTLPTGKLLQDMGAGLIRIALECEKKPNEKIKIIEEPIWTMFCNGKKLGYGVKREPTDEDMLVMQTLHVISQGAGVIPSEEEQPDGELAYMRAYFERVIGSKDSETYYMMNPDGNNGPELSIFFVRL